jgi:enoyl-CoA hydratase
MLRVHSVFQHMNRARAVFIAAINGAAMGGGCELALACDIRIIARDGGPVGQTESLFGLTPGGGSTQRLTRMLGQARALELILEGRAIGPREAVELGLAHRMVSAEDLLREAWATAERLARRAPHATALAKRAVYEGGSKSIRAGLHIEQSAYLSTTVAPPPIRAMRAYLADIEKEGSPALADAARRQPWSEGTAVDLLVDNLRRARYDFPIT